MTTTTRTIVDPTHAEAIDLLGQTRSIRGTWSGELGRDAYDLTLITDEKVVVSVAYVRSPEAAVLFYNASVA